MNNKVYIYAAIGKILVNALKAFALIIVVLCYLEFYYF